MTEEQKVPPEVGKTLAQLREEAEVEAVENSNGEGVEGAIFGTGYYEYGSVEHKARIQSAFRMTFEQADEIIKFRPDNPTLYPYEVWERAKKMYASLQPPLITASKPHWEREIAR